MKILRATKKDLPALLALNVELNEFVERLEPREKRDKNYASTLKRFYEKQFSRKNKRVLFLKAVDSKSGAIIGLVRASIEEAIPIFKEKRFLRISDVFVKLRFRRKGVATALIRSALVWGKGSGLKHAELLLEEKNAVASVLYVSLGFSDWKKRLWRKL